MRSVCIKCTSLKRAAPATSTFDIDGSSIDAISPVERGKYHVYMLSKILAHLLLGKWAVYQKNVKDHHHLSDTNRENFPPKITYPQEEFGMVSASN